MSTDPILQYLRTLQESLIRSSVTTLTQKSWICFFVRPDSTSWINVHDLTDIDIDYNTDIERMFRAGMFNVYKPEKLDCLSNNKPEW